MILIISFNARVIAQLAKQAGLEFAVVDFWGDQDLFGLSDKIYTVFKPELKSYHAFSVQTEKEEKIVDLALEILSKEEIGGIIIGSGLDDRPDLWEKLATKAPILGNKPQTIRLVRNLIKIHELFQQENIMYPRTLELSNILGLKRFSAEVKMPVVVKPKKSVGGVGIKLFQNHWDLIQFFEENKSRYSQYYVQEFIRGINISTTIIGNGSDAKVLSLNEQLIGLEKYGTKLPFKYCGNIIPFKCPPKVERDIEKISIYISKMFQLVGVFGIDFVLKDNIPYFMEINPRFPGLIDILFRQTLLNPVRLHLEAIKGKVPKRSTIIPEKMNQGFNMKTILFAKQSFMTPTFKNISDISDIPPSNIQLKPEDPICTIYKSGKTRKKVMNKMDWSAVEICSHCYNS